MIEKDFDVPFVANEQVAVTTVATRVVKGDQLMRINVDE